jgi:hypothetical protein
VGVFGGEGDDIEQQVALYIVLFYVPVHVYRCPLMLRQEGHVHCLQHADRGRQVPGPHQLWRYNRNSQQLLKLCHSQLGELIINSKARKEDNVFHLYLHRYFRVVRKPKYLLPAGFRIRIHFDTDPDPAF